MKRRPTLVPRYQHGLVLIDALIAIVIFSIGILGMVSLQSAAVKQAGDAKYRTDAAMLADRVIAQMWASDPTQLAANYATGSSCTAPASCYSTWAADVAAALPGVSTKANAPSITVGANNLVTVTVNWQAPEDTSSHNYVSISQITR